MLTVITFDRIIFHQTTHPTANTPTQPTNNHPTRPPTSPPHEQKSKLKSLPFITDTKLKLDWPTNNTSDAIADTSITTV